MCLSLISDTDVSEYNLKAYMLYNMYILFP